MITATSVSRHSILKSTTSVKKSAMPSMTTEATPLLIRFCSGVASDRKSTRLNSSHSQISYAVFCLKKKKKEQELRYSRAPLHADHHSLGDGGDHAHGQPGKRLEHLTGGRRRHKHRDRSLPQRLRSL